MVSSPARQATPVSRRRRSPNQPIDAGDRYLNRELSWLAYAERVLALAEDATAPLLERVRFLAIVATNLDEFFQVRVAGLKRQQVAGLAPPRSIDGLTPSEQLARIAERSLTLAQRQADLFAELSP